MARLWRAEAYEIIAAQVIERLKGFLGDPATMPYAEHDFGAVAINVDAKGVAPLGVAADVKGGDRNAISRCWSEILDIATPILPAGPTSGNDLEGPPSGASVRRERAQPFADYVLGRHRQ